MARQLQRPSQQDFQHQLVQGSSLRLVRLALGAVLPLRVVQAPQVALAPQAALAERL
jgi:hypothetical protein